MVCNWRCFNCMFNWLHAIAVGEISVIRKNIKSLLYVGSSYCSISGLFARKTAKVIKTLVGSNHKNIYTLKHHHLQNKRKNKTFKTYIIWVSGYVIAPPFPPAILTGIRQDFYSYLTVFVTVVLIQPFNTTWNALTCGWINGNYELLGIRHILAQCYFSVWKFEFLASRGSSHFHNF